MLPDFHGFPQHLPALLDPVAPLPRPDDPRAADSRVETHHVELVMLKKSVGATPLNSCGFAVYSVECMRRRLQPQEPP